jgi:hypothetical protein
MLGFAAAARGKGYPMKHYFLASALIAAASPAMADSCASIRAFNDKAPSMAAMKIPPCHCIPMRERADKVYSLKKPAPAGFTCGNGVFYDKTCHLGMTCYREGVDY